MPTQSWIFLLPKTWVPYAQLLRLDRPMGIWLLFFPCVWSLGLADTYLDPKMILLFFVGAVFARGAGCVWNDWVDRDLDAMVARTCSRPFARKVLSFKHMVIFLGGLSVVAVGILSCFNAFTIWLGLSSILLVGVYPFSKRFTFWPQCFLGLTFSWGALMGWAAVHGSLTWVPVLLYGSCFFWILAYDTIYAYQDQDDDRAAGVRSTALYLGANGKGFIGGCYLLFYAGLLWIKVMQGWSWVYGSIILVAFAFSIWQLVHLSLNDKGSCLHAFRNQQWIGWLIWVAISITDIL